MERAKVKSVWYVLVHKMCVKDKKSRRINLLAAKKCRNVPPIIFCPGCTMSTMSTLRDISVALTEMCVGVLVLSESGRSEA